MNSEAKGSLFFGDLISEKKENEFQLGIGLSVVTDWNENYPFIDLMKQSRDWMNWEDEHYRVSIDEFGWVNSLESGATAGSVFLVHDANKYSLPYRRVVVTYDGKGEIDYPWAGRLVKAESRDNRHVVEIGSGSHLLRITKTDPDNYIRNIRIIPENLAEEYERGEIFNPAYVKSLQGFKSIRFMDWMVVNSNPERKKWASRKPYEYATWAKGVPVEVMVQLANRLGADPWFSIPHVESNDNINQFARYLKKNLNPDLNIYVEHTNEIWNWQFAQSHYAVDMARVRWGEEAGGGAWMQWHGMRTAKICNTFKEDVFVDHPERVKCVMGVQAGWRGLHVAALTCPNWVKEGNEECYKHGIDYLGIAGYFDGGLNGPGRNGSRKNQYIGKIKDWADSGEKGLLNAFKQLKEGGLLRKYREDIISNKRGVYNEMLESFEYWNDEADKFGLRVVAYEGGQHITANGQLLQEDKQIIKFHTAINNHPKMEKIYFDLFCAWQNSGGGLFTHFNDIYRAGKHGSWGALSSLYEEEAPKWTALKKILNKDPEYLSHCEDLGR